MIPPSESIEMIVQQSAQEEGKGRGQADRQEDPAVPVYRHHLERLAQHRSRSRREATQGIYRGGVQELPIRGFTAHDDPTPGSDCHPNPRR